MSVCNPVLGGSWVVVSRVISRVTILITYNPYYRGLVAPLIATPEPPSNPVTMNEAHDALVQWVYIYMHCTSHLSVAIGCKHPTEMSMTMFRPRLSTEKHSCRSCMILGKLAEARIQPGVRIVSRSLKAFRSKFYPFWLRFVFEFFRTSFQSVCSVRSPLSHRSWV